jgi:hypothetical protein
MISPSARKREISSPIRAMVSADSGGISPLFTFCTIFNAQFVSDFTRPLLGFLDRLLTSDSDFFLRFILR